MGVYLRLDNIAGANLYEQMGMLVAAGILYIPWHKRELAEILKAELLNQPIRWFCDQHAILKVYRALTQETQPPVIYDFAVTEWLDWEFVEDSYIWTGKGDRKHSEKYLNEKSKHNGISG
jgi:hypothetical protein